MSPKILFAACLLSVVSLAAVLPTSRTTPADPTTRIITGADQTDLYVPYLRGKRIGMLVNQTSTIGNKLSVDSLLSLGINIKTIFGPDHPRGA